MTHFKRRDRQLQSRAQDGAVSRWQGRKEEDFCAGRQGAPSTIMFTTKIIDIYRNYEVLVWIILIKFNTLASGMVAAMTTTNVRNQLIFQLFLFRFSLSESVLLSTQICF